MVAHISVLLDEVLAAFRETDVRLFFDGTVGAGGHAEAILLAHPEIERYFACDRDPKAQEIAKERLQRWEHKIDWISGSYADVDRLLDERGIGGIDGFLVDLGVSSMQLDAAERGFSFRFEGPLDMRMDPDNLLTAERIVNEYSKEELEKIFWEYGEERQSRRAAEAIVVARKRKRIRTTTELVEIVKPVLRWGAIHPATLIFQALRIAVNSELDALERGIQAAIARLNVKGRIAAISFHSLEDRIVKHRLKEMQWRPSKRGAPASGCLEIITKKPIVPTEDECRDNPRARSAKLRVAEKIEGLVPNKKTG